MSDRLKITMSAEAASLISTYERFPVLFERGEGVYLYDSEGRRYLDFLSGIGVNALGHSHPAIVKALTDQAAKLIHISNLFFHQYQAEVAELLKEFSGLDRVFFCNSGTEAWEGALKLARAHALRTAAPGSKGKWRFLMMENSFHGRTFGSLSTTGQEKYRAPFEPLVPEVRFVRFNDVDDLKAKFDDSICAVGMEVIQGEGGIQPASSEFIQAARELTRQSGALLICDEIQSGLGRTGRYFAYQHFDVKPDVVTTAKPLAAGLPLGALLVTEEVAAAFRPGMHGTTFGGGPLTCAVAKAFLNELKNTPILQHTEDTGDYFVAKLKGLAKEHSCIVNVRGKGLMIAMELNSADLAKKIVLTLLERGVIINRTHETVLRFLPPYIIERQHVDQVVQELNSALTLLTTVEATAHAGKGAL